VRVAKRLSQVVCIILSLPAPTKIFVAMPPVSPSLSGSTCEAAVDRIVRETATLREQLFSHSIYSAIADLSTLRVFMSHHAFAVLDFMWLLKRLQREVSCVSVPWLPSDHPDMARFVNEIVLGEETDEDGRGGYCSHFELYLEAMADVGAPVEPIRKFVSLLRSGTSVSEALAAVQAPDSVQEFVCFTHQIAVSGTPSEVAAAFCFGREDVIPEMFQRLLNGFHSHGVSAPRLTYYIQRHIELDGDHHGPLTRQLVNQICSQSAMATDHAVNAAAQSMAMRIRLWDGVLAALPATKRNS
jgi:hypothetical protein